MKKKVGIIKRIFALLLIFLLSINSFAAVVSDNDGSAFITKAEFDALKSSFQAQIDSYNQSIDSKIDGAIASYLAGIKLSKQEDRLPLLVTLGTIDCVDSKDFTNWDYHWAKPTMNIIQCILYGGWNFLGTAIPDGTYRKLLYANVHTQGVNQMHKLLLSDIQTTPAKEAFWEGVGNNENEVIKIEYYTGWENSELTATSTSAPRYLSPADNLSFQTCTGVNSCPFSKIAFHYGTEFGGGSGWSTNNKGSLTVFEQVHGITNKNNIIVWEPRDFAHFSNYDKIDSFGVSNLDAAGSDKTPYYSELFDGSTTYFWYTDGNNPVVREPEIELIPATLSGSISGTIWPGASWNSDIDNWKYVKNKNFGTDSNSASSDKYLFAYEGLPFVVANPDEIMEYTVKFSDNANYELVIKDSPFLLSAPTTGNKKLSKNKTTWSDKITVKTGDKIYMDFTTVDTIASNTTLYLKWHGTASTKDGGGTLLLDNTNPVIVTKAE